MAKMARIVNNTAVDVADAALVSATFHPDLAAQFVSVPDAVVVGSTKSGSTWTAPAAATPDPVIPPVISPMDFYLAFAPAERIAIRGSADPVVKEFWATYELAAQMSHPINMGLVSVVEGITYLSITNQQPATTPASTYIAPSRLAQILAGAPQ